VRTRQRLELSTSIGSVVLSNPVLTASGTSGHGAELSAYGDLAALGAVVVKSLSAEPWPGNPPPRLKPVRDGMVNSVGLQGPGIRAWLADDLPALLATGAKIVASIWGRRVEEFARAAEMIAEAPAQVIAVEVNVSCPNLERDAELFSMSPEATAAAVEAAGRAGRPRWAKLSPAAPDLVGVARAALGAGAEALVLTNTMPADALDAEFERPQLGLGAGGLSGPRLLPMALQAVATVARACPGAPIVGTGGVSNGDDVVEYLAAGARAVEVGTATLLDPRAPWRVLADLRRVCENRGVSSLAALFGSGVG